MEYLKTKTLYLEVTHACNQTCKHCYLDGGLHQVIEEMTTEQIIFIIRQFKEQGGKYIIITGGEPFVRKDIFTVLDYIEKQAIPFTFASNSLAMNNVRLERLSRYKCLDLYFTSILGADAVRHLEITRKDSYEKAIHAIRHFTEKGINVYVQVTLANNYIEDMEQIAEKLLKFNNCTVKFTPIASLGMKKSQVESKADSILVRGDRIAYFEKLLTELKLKYPNKIEESNIRSFDQIKDTIDEYKDKQLYSLAYGFIAVRPNGDISFSCNIGNPFTFGKAYENIKIPVDGKLLKYIDFLRSAENAALQESRDKFIELDVVTDGYIKVFASKRTK